jgi:hypothetical protein
VEEGREGVSSVLQYSMYSMLCPCSGIHQDSEYPMSDIIARFQANAGRDRRCGGIDDDTPVTLLTPRQ